MKKLTVICLFVLIVITISTSFLINSSSDIITEIGKSIKSGNSANVSKYFNSTLDLTVPGNEGTYSKSQAMLILKEFFSKNPPKTFAINHQGSSNDGSLYAIGTYTCASGSFRTYFLVKSVNSSYLIQKLEFEK